MAMLNKDYIVDQFVRFAEAIRMSMERSTGGDDPQEAIDLIETQVGESVNIDGHALLSLAPESVASILQVSDTDPCIVEYMVRSLMVEADLLQGAGESSLASLRNQQAQVVAQAYGISLTDEMLDPEELERFFDESLGMFTDGE